LIDDGTGKAESEQARIAAINIIIDRAYGKATQVIAGDPDNPLQVNIASQIMSTINGAGRPLPGASQEADRGNAEDADEPEVAAEQSVPH
jgi:hypothetical protein